MKTVKLCKLDSKRLIRATAEHPSVWRNMAEFGQEAFYPVFIDGMLDYWGVFCDDCYYGAFRIDTVTSSVKEIHTMLLPKAHGVISKLARDEMEKTIIDNYKDCRTLITKIPVCNRLAISYAKKGGMIEVGVISNAWESHNGVVDIVIMQKSMGR